MARTLLIISGGIEAVHGIKRAKEMGLHVVVSDMDPNAPGFDHADDCLIASTYDAEATVRAAADYVDTVGPIHGVIAMGADVPLTVASVAAAFSLPGLPIRVAHVAMDKLAMKRELSAQNIPVPWYAQVTSARELHAIRSDRNSLVVKPVDSRGSRGVVRLLPGIDSGWAFEQAREISPTGRVMVEDYLQGPQISTESIIVGPDIYTLGFSDRNYPFLDRFAPYFIENGGDLPSHLPADAQNNIRTTVALAASALGYTMGTVKGDVVYHEGRAHIIELAPRLSGGYFCTLEIPLNTGVDFVGCAIRSALGDRLRPAEITPTANRAVAQRYLFPPPGRILAIENVERARALPGIEHVILSKKPGDIANTTKDSTGRAVMVIATGRDTEEAAARAEAAIAAISVVTDAPIAKAAAR